MTVAETFIEQCRCGRDLIERYSANESGVYSYYVCSDDACEGWYRSGWSGYEWLPVDDDDDD